MQYILNETEYQAFQALKEENAKLSHKLEVSRKTREMDRDQIDELNRSREILNKALADKTRELLAKEAELAFLSSQVQSLIEENQTYCNQIAEIKRDCKGTSARLAETEKISATRLDTMNHLQAENRRLKSERVCIAVNPKTGTTKVVSVVKADTYRKFGWTVTDEYIVDRPA